MKDEKIKQAEEKIKNLLRTIHEKDVEINGLYATLEERDGRITKLEQVIVNAAMNRYAEAANV